MFFRVVFFSEDVRREGYDYEYYKLSLKHYEHPPPPTYLLRLKNVVGVANL